MELDPLLLSRIQFALTVGFHFLFPPLSIGLAYLIVWLEWLGWRRGDEDYARAGAFFGKLLGLTFAVGVATGIVMEFQFGTNWAEYSKFVGDVFGAPLAAEAVFAFFLESTFLGLYLFGRGRVSPGVHWFSILMVALGATLSAFWILVANSWQQTPAGYALRNGRAELTSFTEAVFNPSTLPRFLHTMVASWTCGAFFMAGVVAWMMLKNPENRAAARTLRLALVAGLIFSLASLFPTGDWHARQVARTQPEKLATIEGLVHGTENAPLVVVGLPRDNPPRLEYAVGLPGLLSVLAHGDADAFVPGMEDLRAAGRPTPPFALTFLSFHAMVGLGTLFIAMTGLGVLLALLGRLRRARWFLWALVLAIPLPLIACQLGWITAEVGRQPWVVYRVLRTDQALSANVAGGEVLFSIILFSAIYLLLGALYVFLVVKKIKRGFPASGSPNGH
ncbi:MAG: cytochrome ubiquinol oxidase subunit I [Pirellulales bacterium]|nr:cytochrome ubiquinol oxidase subunit I [Pirellulales bacterium]